MIPRDAGGVATPTSRRETLAIRLASRNPQVLGRLGLIAVAVVKRVYYPAPLLLLEIVARRTRSDAPAGDREADVAVGRAQDVVEPELCIRTAWAGAGIALAPDRSPEVAAICRSSVSLSDT
jgi:hypothetical protein